MPPTDPSLPRTAPLERRPAAAGRPPIEIRRSARRRRTSQAQVRGGTLVIQVPLGLSSEEEDRIVSALVDRVVRRTARDKVGDDAALARRADKLADQYLDGVRASEVRWSARMNTRYGSCTPATGVIRISDRLAQMPGYVLDSVIIHELAHLIEANHGPRFQALLDRYPFKERADGYLEGFAEGFLAAGSG